MDITEKLRLTPREKAYPTVTSVLKISTCARRSCVREATPVKRLIQPISFD